MRPESKIAAGRTFGGGGCVSTGEVERESFSHLDKNTSYKAKQRQGWHLLPLKLSQTQFSSGLALKAGDFSAESAGRGECTVVSNEQ